MGTPKEKTINLPYQLFTLILCLLVIGMLLFDTSADTNDEVKRLLTWTDYALCILFFLDFIYVLVRMPFKTHYFVFSDIVLYGTTSSTKGVVYETPQDKTWEKSCLAP